MNSKDLSTKGAGSPGDDRAKDDVLESLFSHVSARQKAPEEDEQAVRNALRSEWQDLVRRRQRRRYFAYGMAASVMLAAVISFNMFRQAPPAPMLQQVATVDKQTGNIFIHMAKDGSSGSRRLSGTTLFTGQVLSTSKGARMGIELTSGESIRLDENTQLAFNSAQEIELISGQVYVDTRQTADQPASDQPLLIRTFAGFVEHLGTQYMVDVGNSTLAVSVREGRVKLSSGSTETIAQPGQQVSVDATGLSSLAEIPTHGPAWEWAEQVSPDFSLDGRSAHDFISWVGRETGHRVSYAPDGAEQLALATELRGNIDLEPMRALELILQTSDLEPVIENGNILINSKNGPDG